MAGSKDREVARIAALRYWRAREARVVVAAWRDSGEGLSAFAARHGIHPGRLSRWAGRLQDEVVQFHPVRLVDAEPGERHRSDPIEIVLSEGCSVLAPAGFAAADLERVLRVLAQAS